jgi:four helix bundle protein
MTSVVQSHRDLVVWPKDELYGLTAQARRAATSVAANIAEGYGRENRGSYQQSLRIAQGSLKELETHLTIAHRVGVAREDAVAPTLEQSESVGKLLRKLSA